MENTPNKINFFTPFFYALLIALGMFMGFKMKKSIYKSNTNSPLEEIESLVKERYVDPVNTDSIATEAIEKYLSKLDPHSVYIAPQEMQSVQEDMEGSFDGIGMEFNIFEDTVYALGILKGGPSEKAGLLPGDKLIAVNDSLLAGKKITSAQVIKQLRGLSGTTVKIKIARKHEPIKVYTLTRGPIPLKSIDATYMLTTTDGYIKLNKFSATTTDEFSASLKSLGLAGMKNLVLDLRDNPGGYLDAALFIADEFIGGKKKLVYTKGNHYKTEEYFSETGGHFEQGKLVILVDENSASASEIMAGIVQDLDRGTIIGRRTFGKGLVQEEYPLHNGGALRLTVARYYLPSGRSIQRAYNSDFDDYYHDAEKRYKQGELTIKDSFSQKDTTIYTTTKGRKVFAGTGVHPDIFVALDTLQFARLRPLLEDDILRQVTVDYVSDHYTELKKFSSVIEFDNQFKFDNSIINGVKDKIKNKALLNDAITIEQIKVYLKAQVARTLYGSDGYFYIINKKDNTILKAIQTLQKAV